ncbi:MAG: serine hydrolase [Planctomycetes bacterium]|nr:serine hydrolase [Planctomycetota bacterium]
MHTSHIAALAITTLAFRAAAQETGSQPFTQERIDAMVVEEAMTRGVPGLGVTIVANGQVLMCRGYGVADVRTSSPVTSATVFNIASVTKPLTAILALDLVDRGVLDLDTRARTLLAWLPASFADITVAQLLSHTSGIVRDVRRDNADDPSGEEYRERIAAADCAFAAGARWEYSNTGYAVLGFLAEAAAGMPLDELLRQRIFTPARMDQATYRTAIVDPGRAQPHQVVGSRAVPVPYVSGGFGSGGIALSAADLANFAVALQRGQLLSAARLAQASTPARLASGEEARCSVLSDDDRYGYGWFLSAMAGHRLLTHGGAIQGFSANLYHFPAERLTIAVVANCKARDDGQAPVDPLCRRLATFCLQEGRAVAAANAEAATLRSELAVAAARLSTAVMAGDAQALRATNLTVSPNRVFHRFYGERVTRHGDIATEHATWYERHLEGAGHAARTGHCLNLWRRADREWALVESVPFPQVPPPTPTTPANAEAAAVRAAVLDYVEGIYGADVERVARSVHPTLAKRGYWREPGNDDYSSEPMTHEQLLATTRTYNQDRRPMGSAPREVTVFEVLDQTASARLVAQWGID